MRVELKGIHTVKFQWQDGTDYRLAQAGLVASRRTGHTGIPSTHTTKRLRKPPHTGHRPVQSRWSRSTRRATTTRSLRSRLGKAWSPWLDRIADHFGELRIAQFDRPEKIRPVIRRWRNQWSDRPRTADYGMQVLSRVLSHAVDPLGKIAGNPCEGIKQLYSSDRSEIIWTDADIAELKKACGSRKIQGNQQNCLSAEIAHAVDLAAHPGLRLATCSACRGRMSARMQSRSQPARAGTPRSNHSALR